MRLWCDCASLLALKMENAYSSTSATIVPEVLCVSRHPVPRKCSESAACGTPQLEAHHDTAALVARDVAVDRGRVEMGLLARRPFPFLSLAKSA